MKAKEKFLIEATKQFGANAVITKSQVQDTIKSLGIMGFGYGHLVQAGMSAGNDKIKLQSVDVSKTDVAVVTKKEVVKEVVKETSQDNATVNLVMGSDIQILGPSPFEGFVSWGHHSTIKQVVKSGMFYPIFVTGLSGNGKTLMIEQVHAELKKELIRVNITIETDEDDLLGGYRQVNGETKFVPGPVIEAMQRGCTLLLDECDLGSNKLMCLQPVLEGKGVYLKKYQKELRTNKVLVCKTAGYDEYYILPSIPRDDESDEDGIQVKENAKTGDLKRAFTKFAKSKTLNRQLLNKFIGQVA